LSVFFFQAEDGIRDFHVTGVQTCALPILYAMNAPDEVAGVIALAPFIAARPLLDEVDQAGGLARWQPALPLAAEDYQRHLLVWRSEERRVGKGVGYGGGCTLMTRRAGK